MVMKKYVYFCFLLVLFFGCNKKQTQTFKEYSQTKFLMDTICEIKIVTEDGSIVDKIFNDVFDKVAYIDKKFGYTDESEVMKVNKYAGTKPVKVSNEMLELIDDSIVVSKITDGSFDITTGILSYIWGFENFSKKTNFVVPEKEKIEYALNLVGYEKILLDKKNKTVFLKQKGMRINLGGIAKGYAIKCAKEIIESYGIKKFLINFGGDIYVKNTLDKNFWKIAIQHPRNKTKFLGILKLYTTSVATSGDYERYFFYNGKRYHHIFDPKTGYPADKTISVSIICDDPVLSDAISTAVFVAGFEKVKEFATKVNFEYIICIEKNGKLKIITSEGVKSYFFPLL